MFIDPKIQFPSDAQPEQVTSTKNTANPSSGAGKSSKTSGVSSATGEDTVSLSSTHGDVQVLTAGLASVPEIRTERVNALKQQVSSGQYLPSSKQVADAIVREYSSINV
jgi:negative regulator of flagellin synthesis FlgM